MADNTTSGWEAVRARHKETGDHFTTSRVLAEKGGHEILEDRPPLDANGNWRPIKKAETISEKSTAKKAGTK